METCPDCQQTNEPIWCETHPNCPKCPVCGYCDVCADDDPGMADVSGVVDGFGHAHSDADPGL